MNEQPVGSKTSAVHRRFLPTAWTILIVALTFVLLVLILQRIPSPKIPRPVSQLRATPWGDRMALFSFERDLTGSAADGAWRMKIIQNGGIQTESEVKPFDSMVEYAGKLWFFSPGMYRVFDGFGWLRYEAPWVGEDPIVAATASRLWLLSRNGQNLALTGYSDGAWDRPSPIEVDPQDRALLCATRCPSRLLIFKDNVHYLWLKEGDLYRLTYDGERFSRVEPIGPMASFEALAEPERILLWYLPAAEPIDRRHGRIGLKEFDGRGWHEAEGIERLIPIGLLEFAPVRLQGRAHLIINNGVQVEDLVWSAESRPPPVILIGADLGLQVRRFLWMIFGVHIVVITAMGTALSVGFGRWKSASGSSGTMSGGAPADPAVIYASLGRRFAAKAIDTAIIGLPIAVAVLSRLDPLHLLFPGSLSQFLLTEGKGLLLAPLLLFLYHSVTEGLWGQTLGKRLLGIRVIGQDRKPCSPGQSMIRNLFRVVDGVWFYGVGVVSIAATDRWQRLGDLAGRTVVVRKRA